MSRGRGFQSAMTWMLIGGCIGAGVALLYSPASGEKNRRRLLRAMEDTTESLTDTAEGLLKRGRQLMDTANEMLDKARAMAG